MNLDHMILLVNDREESVRFYSGILGFTYEGDQEPFSVIRVSDQLTLQLASWGTRGGSHLAFALSSQEFDAAFRRIRESGVEFGDAFDSVGNMKGPGVSTGARGEATALYCFDPNKHLIEIRCYD